MKIQLLNTRLGYIFIGVSPSSGKTHVARIEAMHTFCGRAIPTTSRFIVDSEIGHDKLCGRCYRTLRKYSDNIVKVRPS